MSNPPHKPTDETRAEVRALASFGMTQEDIGTYIGVAIPALFAAFHDPIDVVWIIIFATVYQQIESYVFTPRVSRATMDVHPAIALGSVFVGFAFFGDGASNAGTFHESLNLAAIWKLPVIFFCENNGYAVTTSLAAATSRPCSRAVVASD